MIALYAAVPSKTLADLSEKRNQGRCCDWCISLHFVFTFLSFFSFCYRRCGSVKVKLVLNFSMQLNSIYTIQNYKLSIYSVFPEVCQTRRFNSQRRFSPLKIIIIKKMSFLEIRTCVRAYMVATPLRTLN